MIDKEDWNPETRYAGHHFTHPATYGMEVTRALWYACREHVGKGGNVHIDSNGANPVWLPLGAAIPPGGITEPAPTTFEALGDCTTFSERIEEAAYVAQDAAAAAMRNTIGARSGKA
jgi:hypothetical protein